MKIVNFNEIPKANGDDGQQDTFELFARDFLLKMNFIILSPPNRGADGGKDLLVEEVRPGKFNSSKIKWLVSCKHKSHSGSSVSPDDEQSITDRLEQFKANGFLGIYSTLPSSGLQNRLDSLKANYEVMVFDSALIEMELLNKENEELLKRYFPESAKKWIDEKKEPTILFPGYEPLLCDLCHKDLMMENGKMKPNGVIAFVNSMTYQKKTKYKKEQILDVYKACKGNCDRTLEYSWYKRDGITGWVDISDVSTPHEYLRWWMAIMNEIRRNKAEYSDEAYKKLKTIILSLAQFVVRNPTTAEKTRFIELQSLPQL